MSDLGETFRAAREESQRRRARNLERSLDLLAENGFEIETLSATHFRIGEYDFWPSTGKFIHRKTKKDGRGVFHLMKKLRSSS